MKKIVVTGATGTIGSALVRVALKHEMEVCAIIRKSTQRMERIPDSSKVYRIFYEGLEELQRLTEIPNDYDCFFHLAWNGTGKMTRDDPVLHTPNILYTVHAVELAWKMGCRRFVGCGSQAEYGPVSGQIGEDTMCSPVTSYGIAKRAAGLLGQKRSKQLGLEYVWGRIFSAYGPHDKDWTMISTSIDTLLSGEPVHFSPGSRMWNYLYETDAAEMLLRLGMESTPEGFYPIANPESRKLVDYIKGMIGQFESPPDCVFDEPPEAEEGLDVDVSKTIEATHFLPKVTFEDGIRNTIQARRRKRNGWPVDEP